MNETGSTSILERLLNRTGQWYPIIMVVIIQVVGTPLIILLTAMPSQTNAAFSHDQGTNLLLFGSIVLLLRNILLIGQFYFRNREMFARLSKKQRENMVMPDPEQEKRAWQKATSASKNYIFFEFLETLVISLIPVMVYGYFGLHASSAQIIQLGLAAIASAIVILLIEILTIDQLFEPVNLALLPTHFEAQLSGIKGMRLWTKLSISLIGLVLISLLLVIPAAYQQVLLISENKSLSSQAIANALKTVINAGIGGIVVGLALSLRIVYNFTIPFRKMIKLFSEIEKGDLSRRIKVSLPDDFGELNIYINHMIGRLQIMTNTLEQQVAERTAQLRQTNKQLEIELAQRKIAQEQLAYSALHDALTDIPNRSLFMDRLEHVMERARRHQNYSYAVLFLDLDHFKVVNDSLGHNTGDLLLIESARRLKSCVRNEDTVARIGGDEFVILLEELDTPTDYILVADRIQQALIAPAVLENNKIFISVSIGIVLGNAKYQKPDDILRDADIAMYHAKRQGRDRYEVFDPGMLDEMIFRMEIENELRKAIENQELIIYYQPILELGTRHIVGFEAVVHWEHPTRGLFQPGEFISIAEETGLIVPIGFWVLDKASRQIRSWQIQHPEKQSLSLHLNFSARQCSETDMVEKIVDILKKNQLDASCLKIGLTESFIVTNATSTLALFSKLREAGIQVQIVDFGSSYSLLNYLPALPIDTLKIDRKFIEQLNSPDEIPEAIKAVVDIAHMLGMKVIAEGAETDEQLTILKALDCEYAQGILSAQPVDSQTAGALLDERRQDE